MREDWQTGMEFGVAMHGHAKMKDMGLMREKNRFERHVVQREREKVVMDMWWFRERSEYEDEHANKKKWSMVRELVACSG